MCVLWRLMTLGFCSVSLCAAYELLGDDGYKLTHTSKKLKFPVTKLRHFNMCCAQIRKKIPVKQGLHFTSYKYIKLFKNNYSYPNGKKAKPKITDCAIYIRFCLAI